MMTFSLRDWQKAAIVRVCKASSKHDDEEGVDADSARLFGEDGTLAALSSWSDDWKVLVYDKDTKRTLSPLFTVAELRALGVTLHMAIDSPRDSISDVSAVYLIRPSAANVRYLVDDAAVGRYRDLSIHFTSPVPRPLLDGFARGCVEAGAVLRVTKVVDHFLSYVATEPRLLTLGMADSYAAYASPACTEATVQAYCKSVADGLFSAFATIGVVPILIASREGPSELVARLLDSQFRDHLAAGGGGLFAKNHLAGGGSYGQDGSAGGAEAVQWLSIPGHVRRSLVPLGWNAAGRPVCLLLDRGLDLAAPLLHASSYGSLVEDTVGPARDGQRVTVPEGEAVREEMSLAGDSGSADGAGGAGSGALLGGLWEWAASAAAGVKKAAGAARGEKAGRQITLDTDADSFWSRWAPAPFPEAIEAHERELQMVMARETEIRQTAGADALAGVALETATAAPAGDRPSDLANAMDSLPALLKRKKVLETHAHLLQAVMSRVAARTLPHFNEWETSSGGGAGSGGYASGSGLDRKLVMAAVADGEKGAFADRLRLAAIYLLLCNPLAGAGAGGAAAGSSAAASAASTASQLLQGMHEETAALLQGLRASLAAGFAAAPGAAGPAAAAVDAHTLQLQPPAEAAYAVAVAALTYIKKLRTMPGSSGLGVGSAGAAGIGGAVGALAQKIGIPSGTTGGKFLSALTNTTAALLNKATTSVQRALQGEVRMPVTRVVQAVCEGKPSAAPAFANIESFLVLDPRAGGPGAAAASAREKTYGAYLAAAQGGAGGAGGMGGAGSGAGSGASASASMAALGSSLSSPATFRSAFVFVVGGGCHAEYHDVLAYAAASGAGAEGETKTAGSVAGLAGSPTGRTIVYGATEMAHPDAFLKQLASLGSA